MGEETTYSMFVCDLIPITRGSIISFGDGVELSEFGFGPVRLVDTGMTEGEPLEFAFECGSTGELWSGYCQCEG